MSRPKILVTAATGKTGRAVVAELRSQGWPVRAVVRRRDERSDALEAIGAEVVVADLHDPATMRRAVKGTLRAYYCPPFDPRVVEAAETFAHAAQAAKLETVVGLSQWIASPTHPAIQSRLNWHVDQILANIPGVAHIRLDPGFFADNYLRLLDFASLLSIFPILTGDSRNAPPANEDIARVATALLVDPEPHVGKSYRPTGPQLLSANDMVAIIRKVLGHRVIGVPMPYWMFTRAARMQGVSPYDLLNFRYYLEDHKQGAFEFGAPNDVVERVTGAPAEDFETTVRRYAAMPFAKKSVSRRLKAFLDFNRVPFSPGYNLDRYAREHGFTPPAGSELAMRNQQWLAARRPQSPSESVATSQK